MAKPIIDDELWKLIEPLLPERSAPRRPDRPGRPPVSDRQALCGILFVLRSGIPWEMLPREMGCGSGMTCWRRLRDWQAAGVWDQLHQLLLSKLRAADAIDFSRVIVDSSSIRAIGGGQKQDRTPPIARARVPSTTWRSKRKASRSRSSSPGRTRTTSPN